MGFLDDAKRVVVEKALSVVDGTENQLLKNSGSDSKREFCATSSFGPVELDSSHRLIRLKRVIPPKKSAAKTAAKASAAIMTAGLSLIATSQLDKPKDIILSVDEIDYVHPVISSNEATVTSSSSSDFGYRPGIRGGFSGGGRDRKSVKTKVTSVSYLALYVNTFNPDLPQIVVRYGKEGASVSRQQIDQCMAALKSLSLIGVRVVE